MSMLKKFGLESETVPSDTAELKLLYKALTEMGLSIVDIVLVIVFGTDRLSENQQLQLEEKLEAMNTEHEE